MPPRPTARDKFLDNLSSTWGSRVAQPPAQAPGQPSYEILPSGSLTVDYALRIGGWAVGRIHEIVGPPGSAKTTLMINTMAEAMKRWPKLAVAYVDVEGTFDEYWATLNGLDLTSGRLDHVYANNSEDAADQARGFCLSGLHSLVVVDSIGGMESRRAMEKDAGDTLVGWNAGIITRMCKVLATETRNHKVTAILVNQLRAPIGSMSFADVSAGPKAMQHATTTRVQMGKGPEKPVSMIFEQGMDAEPVTAQFKARVTRNKTGPSGRTATFWVNERETEDYGAAGLNRVDEYLTLGIRIGAVKQDGAWYTIPGLSQVQGRSGAVRQLRGHPEAFAAIREQVLAAA